MTFKQEKAFRKLVNKARRIAILSHIDSDHDSLCSSFALQEMLVAYGKVANVYLDKLPSANYDAILEGRQVLLADNQKYDLAIVLDLSEVKRLGSCAGMLTNASAIVNIDHHPEVDDFANLVFRTTSTSSACEILFWLTYKFLPYNNEVAKLLYIGIHADSGGFAYTGVNQDTFKCIAELYKFDNDYSLIVEEYLNNWSLKEFQLGARAMQSVSMHLKNQVAVSFLSMKDFKDLDTTRADSKFIVAVLKTVQPVRVAVSICEERSKYYRVSIRATGNGVDVSRVAKAFGGGGHKKASGFDAKGDIKKVVNKIVGLCAQMLDVQGER